MFGNIAMWRSTINALRNSYRVIVPRLPLYDVPIHRANFANLVEIFNDFLEWHQLNNVILIGTDIGGQLALDYSYQYPHRVSKVIISGSSGLFENLPVIDKNFNKDYDSIKEQVDQVFYKKDLAGANVVNNVYQTLNSFSKGLHVWAFSKASRENEVSNYLHKLETPVLMIWGLQDRITPPEVALHFHDLLRFGTVKFIDECGHLPMIEQADLYNEAILDFIN
jgi:2-hydroxy-6-oxonona-2,4-dienedioate hydrolase